MHVFMTGATGYLGGVVAEHLLGAGHTVSALARSEGSRERAGRLGLTAVAGGLEDLDVLRAAVAGADAVVHTAVDYLNPRMPEIERNALGAMLDGTDGGRPFVYTSTGLVYPDTGGVPVDEDHPVDPAASPQPYKIHGERAVLAHEKAAGIVVRAALVYGRGGSGLLEGMIGGARARGAATYIGEGANRWSSVHVDDLARLYVAAVERGTGGTVVNASSGEPASMREIAEAVARITATRAVSITFEQAAEALGPYAAVLVRSSPLDASRAERLFGWRATAKGLLDELTTGSYAAAA
ncbi:NAD-dependent epimerase/dehydratase family protein [Microbispora corallina]|uniref:NAD-dependent epimerase/dehydratase domain-containing protein n=1 Tax=Microbispora corallina TaxID=83302 RepID=A0ABQ4GAN0_9ACTN|nr:NAD-dependent epimerase/dehydratase family protein [Microbispora corallina]GIH44013.1 hypothetical protein Mco01_70130 [Microbispora corallina]